MTTKNYIPMPVVIKKEGMYERSYDIYSRLLEERIVFIPNEINDDIASIVVAELLYLEAQDSKKDICVYINSPGGSISAGMAIYDTMKYIKPDVTTICTGMAASMGAFLLAGGTKGKRYALPNAEILIHQPLGGTDGMTQATDIDIAAKHIMATKDKMCKMFSEFTGKTYDEIYKAIDRDNWMSAEEALAFGLIDKVIEKHD